MYQRKKQYKQPFSKAAIILTFTELGLYQTVIFFFPILFSRMIPDLQPEVTAGPWTLSGVKWQEKDGFLPQNNSQLEKQRTKIHQARKALRHCTQRWTWPGRQNTWAWQWRKHPRVESYSQFIPQWWFQPRVLGWKVPRPLISTVQ